MLKINSLSAFAVLLFVAAPMAVSGGKRTVHVTGYARLQAGDYVEVRYPGSNPIPMPTAYANYQLDVPYGVIVTAKIRDNEGKQASRVVTGAAWDKKDGGDAQRDKMTMPGLSH